MCEYIATNAGHINHSLEGVASKMRIKMNANP